MMIVIKTPIHAINKKEMRKLKAPAIIPIRGGPIKNPKKPILETAVNAIPGEVIFDFPASL